jgi:hypothetical protein
MGCATRDVADYKKEDDADLDAMKGDDGWNHRRVRKFRGVKSPRRRAHARIVFREIHGQSDEGFGRIAQRAGRDFTVLAASKHWDYPEHHQLQWIIRGRLRMGTCGWRAGPPRQGANDLMGRS